MIYPTRNQRYPSDIFLMIACLLFLASCQKSPEPDVILQRCFDAVLSGDFLKAYEYFCFDDRSVKGAADFIKEHQPTKEDVLIKEFLGDRISYGLEGVKQGEDTTLVSVSMVIPEHLIERLDFILSDVAVTDTTDSVYCPALQCHIYLVQIHGQSTLVRDIEGWRVFGNWEALLQVEAQRVKERYEYLGFIKIRDIKVYGHRGDKGAYLTAWLHNTGPRTLGVVELMIVCYNKSGTPRYTVEFFPVTANDTPLAPAKKRCFKVDLTKAPADWAKTVDIKVINCWFLE